MEPTLIKLNDLNYDFKCFIRHYKCVKKNKKKTQAVTETLDLTFHLFLFSKIWFVVSVMIKLLINLSF